MINSKKGFEPITTIIVLLVIVFGLFWFAKVQPEPLAFFDVDFIKVVNKDKQEHFVEGDTAKVELLGNPFCSQPKGQPTQYTQLVAKAIFVDGELSFCNEQINERESIPSFVCNTKEVEVRNSKGQSLTPRTIEPTFKTKFGEPLESEVILTPGEHEIDYWVFLRCPKTLKLSDGWYSDFTTRHFTKTINVERTVNPGYNLVENTCIYVSNFATYNSREECEQNIEEVKIIETPDVQDESDIIDEQGEVETEQELQEENIITNFISWLKSIFQNVTLI